MHNLIALWSLLATITSALPHAPAVAERDPSLAYDINSPVIRAIHGPVGHRRITRRVTTTKKTSSTKKPTSTKKTSTSTKKTSSSTRKTSSTPPPSLTTKKATVGTPIQQSTTTTRSSSSPTPSASGTSPGAAAAKLYSGSDYQAAVLFHHNEARANHNAAPLTWNANAAAHALYVANMCKFAHYLDDSWNEGQNIFATSGQYPNVTSGITENWYKGEFDAMKNNYGLANPPNFEAVGHLTQMVWKETTSVGCASVDCTGRMIVNGQKSTIDKFTVCDYSPPGNWDGEFGTQVGKPNSYTNLGHWYD